MLFGSFMLDGVVGGNANVDGVTKSKIVKHLIHTKFTRIPRDFYTNSLRKIPIFSFKKAGKAVICQDRVCCALLSDQLGSLPSALSQNPKYLEKRRMPNLMAIQQEAGE